MPGNWRRFVVIFGCLLAGCLSGASAGAACPFCPPTGATLSETLDISDVACVATFIESKSGAELSMETTQFEVARVLRAKNGFKVGTKFTIPFGVTGEPGNRYLLMGESSDGMMQWNLPIPMDELEREYRYVASAPSPERPQVERLRFFLKHLDSNVPTISLDAFSEFAKARFEDVEQLAPELSREKIRGWLEDPNPQMDVRRAFYGLLLGLCGNDSDAAYLERKILAPIDPAKNRLGIEGMMGGYLLLRGQPGLTKLVEHKIDVLPKQLSADDPRIVDVNALRTTLSFLWDYRQKQFTRESLCSAMRKFLNWPEFADMAVVDLARWKDWEPLDRLIAAYGRPPWETRSAQEKIVAYALACRRDIPPSGKLPPAAVTAQKFLDTLDPALIQSVRRTMGTSAVLKDSGGSKPK